MRLLQRSLRTLLVILVAMSVMGSTTCSRKPNPPSEVVICPSSAFINLKEYEIEELKTLDDKEFHAKMAELAKKYPDLKNAYADLLECWDHYHPREK